MSFIDQAAKAQVALSQNYLKEGTYWAVIEAGKEGRAQFKGFDFVAYDLTTIRCVKPASDGNSTKELEAVNILFVAGQKGSDTRLKQFALIGMGFDYEQAKKIPDDKARDMMSATVNPVHQEMKNVIVEIEAKTKNTQSGKEIVATDVRRRVWPSEVQAPDNWKKLPLDVQQYLTQGGRLQTMLAKEAQDRPAFAAYAAGLK